MQKTGKPGLLVSLVAITMSILLIACGDEQSTKAPAAVADATVAGQTTTVQASGTANAPAPNQAPPIATTAASGGNSGATISTPGGANTKPTTASGINPNPGGSGNAGTGSQSGRNTAAPVGVISVNLPTMNGLTELKTPPGLISQTEETLSPDVPLRVGRKFLLSEDDSIKVSEIFHTAMLGGGYRFVLPASFGVSNNKPAFFNGSYMGFYAKNNNPDVWLTASPVARADISTIKSDANISEAEARAIADQLKGKRTVVMAITSDKLIETITSLNVVVSTTGTPTTPSTGVAVHTTPATSGSSQPVPTTVPGTGTRVSPTAATNAVQTANGSAGYNFRINAAETVEKIGNLGPLDRDAIFVAVDVTLLSQQERGVNASMVYAKLRDTTGKTYNPSFVSRKPLFPEQNDVPKGEEVRGWLVFEVARSEAKSTLTFVYEPIVRGARVSIQLPLSGLTR
jgi:Domain of unknown function (DUF4352)